MPLPPDARSRVRQALQEMIATAVPGARLPSERALCARLGVARMTLRTVMDQLVQDGVLERRRGSGTYVRRPLLASRLQLLSFTEEMRLRGLVPTTRVVEIAAVDVPRPLARALHLALPATATRITRVRCGDGNPIGVETVHIPAWTGMTFTAAELEGSLYEAVRGRYGIEVASASMHIRVERPDPEVSAHLELEAGSDALRIEMIDADADGRPIMAALCWYHPERYQIELTTASARRMVGHAR